MSSKEDSVWQDRRFPQKLREGDVRTEYQRDHARLVHSSAFRRLQSKTQVIGLGESDFYRTRLTHSMEVAQIGTGINYFLSRRRFPDEGIRQAIAPRALINAICLAHDIGHPPFGHGGEVALNYCMRDYGGFEGNGQTLRVLAKLDRHTDGFGLNPTRRMLMGVLKYPSPYSHVVNQNFYAQKDSGKPSWLFKAKAQKPPKCYLDSDRDVVEWVFEGLSVEDRERFVAIEEKEPGKHKKPVHKSLDTSIMEIADDISYSIHDLEDAIALRMVSRKQWDDYCQEAMFSAIGLSLKEVGDNLFHEKSTNRKDQIGDLVNRMITKTTIRTSKIPDAESPYIRYNAYLGEAESKLLAHLQEFVKAKVIASENVQLLEFKGQKLIVEIFEVLAEDPDRFLPEATKKRHQACECQNSRMRVLSDFISGMTDDYATRLYEKIFSPRRGSIFERL